MKAESDELETGRWYAFCYDCYRQGPFRRLKETAEIDCASHSGRKMEVRYDDRR